MGFHGEVLLMNAVRMLILALLLQGAPQPGTASLEGVVVKAGTNDPIPGADLELTMQTAGPLAPNGPLQPNMLAQYATPNPPYTATSGADGKFTFRNIAAGNYKLVAARIGGSFTPVELGQRGALGRGVVFPIANGEQKKNVRLEMAPVGSITGRILDVDNRPVGHAAVMAFAPFYRNGERIVTMLELVHSDDHGEYRLFSLTPGRYYVAARLEDLTRRSVPLGFYPPGRMLASDRVESPVVIKRTLPSGEVAEETYQIVYFGGGTNPDLASPIDVGMGAIVSGVDISLATGKVPSRHIRGTILASANTAFPAGTRVVAIPQRYASDMLLPVGLMDSKGAFDLAGAVPGKYYLTALVQADPNIRTTPPPQPQYGVLSIEVGEGNMEGVSITATPGFPVSGKIFLENRPEADPDLAKLRVEMTPDPWVQGFPSINWNPTFSPNGEFTFRTLQQGDYFPVVTGLPANSYTKSIRMGIRDLMLTPLHVDGPLDGRIEVVVGTDAATLSGRIFDEHSEPSINVKVALIPDLPLRRRWDLYRSTTTDQSGNFTIRLVAPGDYKVFAWEEADDNIWTMSDFLREDEGRGKAVHIGSSAVEKIDIPVIPAKRR
jgi:hypothetical protein